MSMFFTKIWTLSEVRTMNAKLREAGYQVSEGASAETFRCLHDDDTVFAALRFQKGRYICRINRLYVTEAEQQATLA